MRGAAVPLVLAALLAFADAVPAHAGPAVPPESQFVKAANGGFVVGGQPLRLLAAACYPYWKHNGRIVRGAAWADPAFPEYIRQVQDLAVSAGVRALRVTDYLDGAPADWRNPVVWANLDAFIAEAKSRQLYVILSASALRKWLIRRDLDPYDPARWTEFLEFLGKRYRDAPNILYIGIAGEVPPVNAKPFDGHGRKVWKGTAESYLRFFRETLATLRAADPNHLLCAGGLSFLNRPEYGIPWKEIFSLPGNDLAAIHVYSEGDMTVSLPAVAAWARARGMPWAVEEFGMKQEAGDTRRAAWFTRVLGAARSDHAALVGFWNLGNEVAPGSYEVGLEAPLTRAVLIEYATSP